MEFVYFASPMCSWCWGFSPVLQKIKKSFPDKDIRLVLTPFRIDTTQPMDDKLRNYVLGQWRKVYGATSQPFDFNFSMPKDFIYNTRLVCLAIKAFKKQLAEQELKFMHALQESFYTLNKDLTNLEILIEIAEEFPVDMAVFAADMQSDILLNQLQEDFDLCQQLSVQSYPTLMSESNGNYAILANGCSGFEDVVARIEAS